MKKVVFAGGGTGGHLFPGLAMAREMRRQWGDVEIVFVGTGRPLERRILSGTEYGYRVIRCAGITDKRGWRKVAAGLKTLRGTVQSIWILGKIRPDIVVGLGGYSSGPVGLAARAWGIPLVLQEQNVRPGVTNRLLSRIARGVLCAYEETPALLKAGRTRVVGNPVREAFLRCPDRRDPACVHILVTGGSQGSQGINRTVPRALGMLPDTVPPFSVTHQAGAGGAESVRAEYARLGVSARVLPFIDDMAEALSRADLVIGRAGATSLSEIAAVGRAALLIPYPHAAHAHQEQNARLWEARGAAVTMREEEMTPEHLCGVLAELISDRSRLQAMGERARALGRNDAAARAVSTCREWVES